MSWTREPVFAALLVKLQTISASVVKEVTRRQVPLANVAPASFPVIYMRQPSMRALQTPNLPERHVAVVDLLIYADAGDAASTIKSTIYNGILDAIDAALAPSALEDKQTLGGLVAHCWAEGDQPIDENVLGRYCLGAVPVMIEVGRDNLASAGQLVFDVGAMFVTPITKDPGVAAVDLSPQRLGRMRSVKIEASQETTVEQVASRAYGIFAMMKLKRLKFTAEFAAVDGTLVDQVFFGAAKSAGAKILDLDRAYAIPASPYQITVAPPSSGTFSDDSGVRWASDGSPLQLVSGSPATGQYARAGAVYTFASADNGRDIALSYTYAASAGSTLTLANTIRGKAPTFSCVLQGTYNGKQVCVRLHRCVTAAFGVPVPVESFGVQSFEFEAFPDDSGELGTWSEGVLPALTSYSTDTTAPTATVSPVNGATGVTLNASLQATVVWTFDEALDGGTVANEVKAWRYNAGAFTPLTVAATLLNSGAATTVTALVTAASGWTVYVFAGGGLTDQPGNHFAGLMSSFTVV